MTSLANHHSSQFVKLLLLGDAKSGKTSSLVDLVEAGYSLRILDMDNLLDPFVFFVRKRCPDKIGNVEFRTIRDKRKMTELGPMIDGPPKAFPDAIKMIDRWRYDDGGTKIDLGEPYKWGPDCILVLDSLSRFCDAAHDWRTALTPASKSGNQYDGRSIYKDAQDAVEDTLATITSKTFETHVIVICHGVYQDIPNGGVKLFPQGVGQKLSPKIPQYFPNYIRYKNQGGKRTIQFKSDILIDLASPEAVPDTLPMEGGLGKFFEILRAKPTTVQPKLVRV